MSMTDEHQPIRPSTETNVLLGRLEAKVDLLMPLSMQFADLKSEVAVLKSQQKPTAPWWSVVAGLSGVVAMIGTATTLVILFTK